MNVFDIFRGFFGVPGSQYRGRRNPFFDALTHDEDDDDDDDDEDAFYHDGFDGDQQDSYDNAWRFGFSVGPNGVRVEEPPGFGHILREMEEIFAQLGHWEGRPESGNTGVPVLPPPPQDRAQTGERGCSRNPLRDFMLKSHDDPPGPKGGLPREPKNDVFPSSPFHDWTPFSKFNDILRKSPLKAPEDELKEDRDLDSAVSSGGLDEILAPPAGHTPNQPRIRSFFQSVTVTKVVKPDGTVEERRTVRDSQGQDETTVTVSGPSSQEGPVTPVDPHPFSDMQDDNSLFSRFFRGFK